MAQNISRKIKLTDSISMEMQWPSYTRMLESDALISGEQDADASFGLIASCIHSVQTGDDNILMKDEPKEEVQTFSYGYCSGELHGVHANAYV